MKFLVDRCAGRRLAEWLGGQGHDVIESTLGLHRVRYLLIGGQACVFYGAAEFSRDTDVSRRHRGYPRPLRGGV